MGNGYTTTLSLEVFTHRNFVGNFIRLKLNFTKNKKPLYESPFGGLSGNVRTPSIARWKARGWLPILVITELFSLSLTLRCYKRKSVKVGVFRRGWVTLSANFRRKEASPTNRCWCQKTKVIALSCGIKIFTGCCLVLSQSTRVTDR